MWCSCHAWTGPAAECKTPGNGATAPAPAGRTHRLWRRRSISPLSACSYSLVLVHVYHLPLTPPHSLFVADALEELKIKLMVVWLCADSLINKIVCKSSRIPVFKPLLHLLHLRLEVGWCKIVDQEKYLVRQLSLWFYHFCIIPLVWLQCCEGMVHRFSGTICGTLNKCLLWIEKCMTGAICKIRARVEQVQDLEQFLTQSRNDMTQIETVPGHQT